jgi:hypothetical protein
MQDGRALPFALMQPPPWQTGAVDPATPSGAWAPPASVPPGSGAPGAYPRTEPLAIISLVAGIGQFLMPIVAAIVAIVCGHIARGKIRRSQGREAGSGMALAGLILGYIGIAFTILAIGGIITIVAVFHDDWARARTHQVARDFSEQIQRVSTQQSTSPRDANVITRAWTQACDCNPSSPGGNGDNEAHLPNGISIWDATNSDYAAAGWQLDVSTRVLTRAYVCLTVPATPSPAPFVDGQCAPGSS